MCLNVAPMMSVILATCVVRASACSRTNVPTILTVLRICAVNSANVRLSSVKIRVNVLRGSCAPMASAYRARNALVI